MFSAPDLVHCYEKALECARWLEDREFLAGEVVVDYTGGTKSMTAALTLATGERAVIYYLTGPGFISGLKACLIDGQADSPSHFLSIRKLNYSTLLFLRGPGSTD